MDANNEQIISKTTLFPIYLAFFAMGFSDMVGIATNYIREEYSMTDSLAGLIPASQYIWFFILSVPTCQLMSRTGRKNTVTAGLLFMALGMFIPLVAASFPAMLPAFASIGIGATLLGVGLNPLLASILPDDRLASGMTIGQTVKSLASIASPAITAMAASGAVSLFGLGWKSVFALYLPIITAGIIWFSSVNTCKKDDTGKETAFSLKGCLSLLKKPVIKSAFLAVMCHVGSDVSLNMLLPRFYEHKLGISLDKAAFSTSLYFIARLAGSLAGVIALRQISIKKCLISSILLLTAGLVLLVAGKSSATLCTAVVLLGLGNANICTLIISSAFIAVPDHRNETSALTMTGLSGGAVFSLPASTIAENAGINATVFLILAATGYILCYAVRHSD